MVFGSLHPISQYVLRNIKERRCPPRSAAIMKGKVLSVGSTTGSLTVDG